MKSRANALIEKVDGFRLWEDRESFLAFRQEVFGLYDALTEAEQMDVDESMVMEHIAMIYSCYVDV